MNILALDPGTTESGQVCYDPTTGTVEACAIHPNHVLLQSLRNAASNRRIGISVPDLLAVEMVASYGMPVGAEIFQTVLWIGRFIEAWGGPYRLVTRIECKSHLCHSGKAKDANIRQALLDKFGPQGTKKDPGRLYGVKSHCWAALAVAVTAAETEPKAEVPSSQEPVYRPGSERKAPESAA